MTDWKRNMTGERWSNAKRPGDLTGRIGHSLWLKKQKQVERDLEQQRRDLERQQLEISQSAKVIPVAEETYDDDYVDYTSPNAAHQPTY
jgi:hypothetical protein